MCSFVIYGTYKGRTEELDTAETEKEAEYLTGEYRMAFGAEWSVYSEEKEENEASDGR